MKLSQNLVQQQQTFLVCFAVILVWTHELLRECFITSDYYLVGAVIHHFYIHMHALREKEKLKTKQKQLKNAVPPFADAV